MIYAKVASGHPLEYVLFAFQCNDEEKCRKYLENEMDDETYHNMFFIRDPRITLYNETKIITKAEILCSIL